MDEISFGTWLKRQRSSRGLTQAQLSQQIGCAAITLRKIESEERRPSEQIVERLSEIFNILPNEHRSFLRFARGDWTSAPTTTSIDNTPWRGSPTRVRSQIPIGLTSLIGREQQIDQVRQYLANTSTRLVTLTGPPGIGKTSLSQQVAREEVVDFLDGVFFVGLAPLADPDLVASKIIQTLRFEGRGESQDIELLKDGIADKQMLLVLDNFEHLLDAAPIVPELLMACPNLNILVTSRESLRVPGEWIYPVPPLTVPPPVQFKETDSTVPQDFSALSLFADRARAVRSDFKLNPENANVIAAICTRLDGLPLAIELIAARIRLMSPQELLSRMDHQFTLYADGMRALSARQKTLHNAITWSYDLLTPQEQNLLVRLGVFAGGFTLDAVAHLTENPNVLNGLTALLDKSLLQRTVDENGETRFTLLFTIREFALQRLEDLNETAKTRDRHLEFFVELAKQADQDIHGPRQVEWLDRLEIEHDNYRTALDWCIASNRIESALYLIGSFSGPGRFWSIRSYFSEARNWFSRVSAYPEAAAYPIAYATALNGMSFISALQSDSKSAIAMAGESQRICQSLGQNGALELAGALLAGGLAAAWFGGNMPQAEADYEQAAAIYDARGTQWERAFALFRLGGTAYRRKDYPRSLSLYEESLVIFRELNDAFGLARVYDEMSFLYQQLGDYDQARKLDEQSLYYDKKLGFRYALVASLISLGVFSRLQGNYDQAETYLEEAANIRYELNLVDENSRFYLGCGKLHTREFAEARLCFIEHLKISQKHDLQNYVGESLIGLGAVAAGLQHYERSARLAGAGWALQSAAFYEMPLPDLLEINPLLQNARNQLGEADFEALVAEGHAMTTKQAIAYALENLSSCICT